MALGMMGFLSLGDGWCLEFSTSSIEMLVSAFRDADEQACSYRTW